MNIRPSIVFFDELDFLCVNRSDTEDESIRRSKTEFLIQIQETRADNMFIIGATNQPWNIDPALRKRFEKRIFFSLPDYYERKRLFQNILSTSNICLKKKEIEILASKSENFNSFDIHSIVKEVLFLRLKTISSSTHFKSLDNGFWVESSPLDDLFVQISLDQIDPQLLFLEFNFQDFIDKLKNIKPITNETVEKYKSFQRDFGYELEYKVKNFDF